MVRKSDDQWVVQITNELRSNECSNKHCIYQIPSLISKLSKRAFKPQVVSFGPYHHGKENVMGMEEHKHRALVHFLNRCEKPVELLIQSMREVEQDLRDSYKPFFWKDHKRNHDDHDDGFLKMMILDGCFMVEILQFGVNGDAYCDYADNDPVFSDHGRLYVLPYVKRDMLMLENQLPMVVLHKLLESEGRTKSQDDEFLNILILKFFFSDTPNTLPFRNLGKCLHIIDLCRKTFLQQSPTHPTFKPKLSSFNKYDKKDDFIMGSPRELQEAGIRFKPSKTQSLNDVSFNGGVLRLPTIVIDDSTETMLFNLVAFERLHVEAGNDVSSYLYFMDNIINTEMDVAILRKKGIVLNYLGSDKDVAKLFNLLSRDLTVDIQGGLDVVQVSVCRYCKRPWNRWRANFIKTYFRNPWAIVSVVSAIIIFMLTIIQTVCTIVQTNQDFSGIRRR